MSNEVLFGLMMVLGVVLVIIDKTYHENAVVEMKNDIKKSEKRIIKQVKENMAGTRAGALKGARTTREKYGENFWSDAGSKGGKAKVCKGFGKNPELARKAGAKGGHNSRRGKK